MLTENLIPLHVKLSISELLSFERESVPRSNSRHSPLHLRLQTGEVPRRQVVNSKVDCIPLACLFGSFDERSNCDADATTWIGHDVAEACRAAAGNETVDAFWEAWVLFPFSFRQLLQTCHKTGFHVCLSITHLT